LIGVVAFLLFSVASIAMWRGPARPADGSRAGDSLDLLLEQALSLRKPVRNEPRRFPPRTYLPDRREEFVSGSPGYFSFDPRADLVRIEDPRVWWESENDRHDTEDDHVFHRSMEEPMRRLIELVHVAGGRLKVQDAYRHEGIHSKKSLHREGRAVDLTCDVLDLEKLAKLAWASGFDWVYYEVPRNNGVHIHASVRADRSAAVAAK
jgi:hypothetical protein